MGERFWILNPSPSFHFLARFLADMPFFHLGSRCLSNILFMSLLLSFSRPYFRCNVLYMAGYGMVWYGVVWCGMVWYGVVWCGMVGCGAMLALANISHVGSNPTRTC
ncbi:hypothetical protein CC80DRAFT_44393 [Byssothecium circinans]|uniref:Uncharacterized protein n=1 Tax=Byssothecium circinans TaxID=147558 RepID=A0A6A5U0F0_9PLEO|nr:hypothetical protein CC80DRAFT_44393 [Byssothecium circinans]